MTAALEDRDPGDENRPGQPRLTPESAADLRPGDTVHHHPSGEDWVLRYVKGDRLSWLGWPPGEASVADCSLASRCSDEEHLAWTAQVNRPLNLLGRGTTAGDEREDRQC